VGSRQLRGYLEWPRMHGRRLSNKVASTRTRSGRASRIPQGMVEAGIILRMHRCTRYRDHSRVGAPRSLLASEGSIDLPLSPGRRRNDAASRGAGDEKRWAEEGPDSLHSFISPTGQQTSAPPSPNTEIQSRKLGI